MSSRVKVLPSRGVLMVSTDLHGCWDDWAALEARFRSRRERGEDVHWVLLGDLVHGPDEAHRVRDPAIYAPDDSPRLIDALWALRQAEPERVTFVLGNHDAGHLGFPHPAKFYADEVAALEARLDAGQRERLVGLCAAAPLLALAPCGLVLSHGSPGDALTSLELLRDPLPPTEGAVWRACEELLTSYGQPRDVTAALLTRLSAESGLALAVVVHGHDRDPSGWYTESGNQAQPVLFGAPRAQRRYLEVDLAASYRHTDALREGVEVKRVHDVG